MDRRGVIAVVGGLCALLLVAVASSGTVRYVERGPQISIERAAIDEPLIDPPPTLRNESFEPIDATQQQLPDVVSTIVKIVIVGCLALFAVWAWRSRPRLTWRRGRRGGRSDDFDVLADVAASVTADAESQQAALRSGEARNAIVECWLRLESLIVGAGISRRPSDTSEELVARVLSSSSVDDEAITLLSALYREARFSSHPIRETARSDAIVALDAVHAGLRESVDENATSA